MYIDNGKAVYNTSVMQSLSKSESRVPPKVEGVTAVMNIDFNRICATCAKPNEMIRQKIVEIPSVTPQLKKGHWIGRRYDGTEWKDVTVYVNSEGNVTESCECSECREWLTGSDEYICSGRYCPNCGARMEAKQ